MNSSPVATACAPSLRLIRTASPMHAHRQIGTPDHVLLKPGKFTPEEFKVITQHTEIGYRIRDRLSC